MKLVEHFPKINTLPIDLWSICFGYLTVHERLCMASVSKDCCRALSYSPTWQTTQLALGARYLGSSGDCHYVQRLVPYLHMAESLSVVCEGSTHESIHKSLAIIACSAESLKHFSLIGAHQICYDDALRFPSLRSIHILDCSFLNGHAFASMLQSSANHLQEIVIRNPILLSYTDVSAACSDMFANCSQLYSLSLCGFRHAWGQTLDKSIMNMIKHSRMLHHLSFKQCDSLGVATFFSVPDYTPRKGRRASSTSSSRRSSSHKCREKSQMMPCSVSPPSFTTSTSRSHMARGKITSINGFTSASENSAIKLKTLDEEESGVSIPCLASSTDASIDMDSAEITHKSINCSSDDGISSSCISMASSSTATDQHISHSPTGTHMSDRIILPNNYETDRNSTNPECVEIHTSSINRASSTPSLPSQINQSTTLAFKPNDLVRKTPRSTVTASSQRRRKRSRSHHRWRPPPETVNELAITTLRTLTVTKCRGMTDASILSLLLKSPNISELTLAYLPNVSSDVFRTIPYLCRDVNYLSFSWSAGITDAVVAEISMRADSMRHLKHLSMARSAVTDKGVMTLTSCLSEIQSLDLSWSPEITDAAIKHIANNLPNLRLLDIRFCRSVSSTLQAAINKDSCESDTLEWLPHLLNRCMIIT